MSSITISNEIDRLMNQIDQKMSLDDLFIMIKNSKLSSKELSEIKIRMNGLLQKLYEKKDIYANEIIALNHRAKAHKQYQVKY